MKDKVDIEKETVVKARLSICKEIKTYLDSLVDSKLDTYSYTKTQQEKDYLEEQIEVLIRVKSFINEKFLK